MNPDGRSFSFEMHPYCLRMAGGGVREGRLIKAVSVDGACGWGDAAPLPGWSRESLGDVEEAFRAKLLHRQFSHPFSAVSLPSSLAFAAETAACHLDGFRELPLLRDAVEINLLLDRSPLSLEVWVAHCLAEGCKTVKVKVRKDDPRMIAAWIGRLRKCLGTTIQLRLDANRAFAFAEAVELLERLAEQDIAYIEEPVEDAASLRKLLPDAAVPVALDETLREIEPRQLVEFPGARALILKPTLLGSIRRVREFADSAEQLGILPVISGCYESGVGTFALARLAASFRSPSAAGLDTYSRLLEDVLPARLDFHGCLLRLNPEPCMPT